MKETCVRRRVDLLNRLQAMPTHRLGPLGLTVKTKDWLLLSVTPGLRQTLNADLCLVSVLRLLSNAYTDSGSRQIEGLKYRLKLRYFPPHSLTTAPPFAGCLPEEHCSCLTEASPAPHPLTLPETCYWFRPCFLFSQVWGVIFSFLLCFLIDFSPLSHLLDFFFFFTEKQCIPYLVERKLCNLAACLWHPSHLFTCGWEHLSLFNSVDKISY